MDRIDDLLLKTSRTFALSIPLLPEPTRRELGVAYLLFRIADTFEDAAEWSNGRQIAALREFVDLIREPSDEAASRLGTTWAGDIPIRHDGYVELLRETPLVMRAFTALADEPRDIIRRHAARTAEGMATFVERTENGVLRLRDIEDLRGYCYVVAGIVGELSTELFIVDHGLDAIGPDLRSRAPRFGEALQLVNILKDAAFDHDEGRRYLPPEVDRDEVFALAREDLDIAAAYTNLLQAAGAPRGVVAFCALPTRLAYATLERVERDGPGSKITRDEVFAITADMHEALDEGRPAVSTPDAVSRR